MYLKCYSSWLHPSVLLIQRMKKDCPTSVQTFLLQQINTDTPLSPAEIIIGKLYFRRHIVDVDVLSKVSIGFTNVYSVLL